MRSRRRSRYERSRVHKASMAQASGMFASEDAVPFRILLNHCVSTVIGQLSACDERDHTVETTQGLHVVL